MAKARSKLPEGFERNPVIRRNRGYWDGVAARERGCQYPIWAKSWIARQSHPFDTIYGAGFWTGFYTAYIVRDDCRDTPPERDDGFWPSQNPKAASYIGDKSDKAFQRQMTKAKAVLKAWHADEWFYCGVCVVIEKHGVPLTGRYDHALWGVDCNYPNPSRYRRNSYLRTVANELLPEALSAAEAKVEQLAD